MPKKSKRRAAAAGKTGKGAGGILTPGALRMLAGKAAPPEIMGQRGAQYFIQSFKKNGPRLQFVEFSPANAAVGPNSIISDGENYVAGGFHTTTFPMIQSKALIRYSIIRVECCVVYLSVVGGREELVLVLERFKVVNRNFGRNVSGYDLPLLLPHTDASANVSPNADRAVPYSNRLEFVRRILLQHADSVNSSTFSFKAEAERYLKVLKLPRVHTEGFRSIFIMEWFRIVEHALEIQAPYAPDELGERFVTDEDLQNSIDLFALIACDDTEQRTVRALANLARAIPTKCENTLKASHINYLRRFLADANDGIADELPPMIDVGTDHSYSPAAAFDGCIEMGRDLLIYREGPPRGENVSPLDRNGHPLNKDHATAPYYSSFGGGCCDCCGKTSAEVGLPHLFKCSRCRLSWYCSSFCQAKSWTQGHAEHCKKIARFAKGDAVVLHGLKQRGDLNGSRVQVEEPLSNGRFRVSLEGGCESTIKVSGGKMTMYTKMLPKKSLSVNKKNLRHQRPLK